MKLQPLTVLSGLEEDEVVGSFLRLLNGETELPYFCRELYRKNAQDDLTAYVCARILTDENPFSRAAAANEAVSVHLIRAYRRDLGILYRALFSYAPISELFSVRPAKPPFFGAWDNDETVEAILAFHRTAGYGVYVDHKAFRFEEGKLVPVVSASDISLADLKGYEHEKQVIDDNLSAFLKGLPYSNMLLYGDRGTGKSSTVHAMLNKYCAEGLRLVELPKEHLCDLTALKRVLASVPLKFIIFIDDLSLEENDNKISTLKASLEGSASESTDNTLITATSNRRHIVKENFSDRDNSVHARDTMEEQLSLSDRFGLTVCFSSTGKKEYLSIIRQLAADDKIEMDDEQLCALAERWALVKGGRSPRRARQFIDYLFSCQAKGTEILI